MIVRTRSRFAPALVLALAFTAAAAGQERVSRAELVDEGIIARIKAEGFQHSSVMETLSWRADVHGPRLTGSPALRAAGEWARSEMTRWGMTNAALESYGSIGRGWAIDRFSIEMTEPQFFRITGYPRAWSPATQTALTGTPIVVEVKSKDDFEKYRGKLRGAIVMNGRPDPVDIGFQPAARRLTDEDLKKLEGHIEPAPASEPGAPKSLAEEEADYQKVLDKQIEIYKFFAAEGIAALVEPSSIGADVRIGGFLDRLWRPVFPGFVISREHYGRVMRMLDKKQPVKLSLSLAARFFDNVDGFN